MQPDCPSQDDKQPQAHERPGLKALRQKYGEPDQQQRACPFAVASADSRTCADTLGVPQRKRFERRGDDEIAGTLNYILSAWDEGAAPEPYTPEEIAPFRDEPLSAEDVYALRQTLKLDPDDQPVD